MLIYSNIFKYGMLIRYLRLLSLIISTILNFHHKYLVYLGKFTFLVIHISKHICFPQLTLLSQLEMKFKLVEVKF